MIDIGRGKLGRILQSVDERTCMTVTLSFSDRPTGRPESYAELADAGRNSDEAHIKQRGRLCLRCHPSSSPDKCATHDTRSRPKFPSPLYWTRKSSSYLEAGALQAKARWHLTPCICCATDCATPRPITGHLQGGSIPSTVERFSHSCGKESGKSDYMKPGHTAPSLSSI